MSHIYIAPLPDSKLDRRGRASGHIYYKLDREGEKYLDVLAKRFSDISSVFSADLAAKPAEYLARKLGAGVWVTRKLRGFNFGKFNGRSWDEILKVMAEMIKKWETNQTVPIVGGDSWTSYERRFIHEMLHTLEAKNSVNVVVLVPHLDMGTFIAVAKHQEHPEHLLLSPDARYKVVKLKVKDVDTSTTKEAGNVPADTNGSGPGHADVGVSDGDAGGAEESLVEPDTVTRA